MRESAYQPEFGLLGAGAVSGSLIGRLPGNARSLGPVAALSYRVASRIANTLKAGTAVRTADELNCARTILFHSPVDHSAALLEVLDEARVEWAGKSLIFCDCETEPAALRAFRAKGASVASVRTCAIPGCLVIGGNAPALTTVKAFTRQLSMKPIELAESSGASFDAAVTLGSGALTPLIDQAASLLRSCGVRDNEAAGLAAALFQQTADEYAHSGKQSWAWYIRPPRAADIELQITAAGERFGPVLRRLVTLGLETFGKYKDAGPPED